MQPISDDIKVITKCERALMVDLDALVYHCTEMKGIKLAIKQ